MKLLLIALATLAAAVPVTAETASTISISVGYAGLDLTTAAGQSRFDRRIAIAAETACGTASTIDVVGKRKADRCRDAAIERAAAQRNGAVALATKSQPVTLAAQR